MGNRRNRFYTTIIMTMFTALVALGGIQAKAATVAGPDAAPTKENVLGVLQNYSPEAYHIMSTQAGHGRNIMTWFVSSKMIEGMDTSVHEVYHGYTSSEAYKHGDGFRSEVLYAGDNTFHYICIDDFPERIVPTEEMSVNIPEELRTYRYSLYVGPGATASSNDKAMMYMLNEFSAYYRGLHTMSDLVPYYMSYDTTGDGWRNYASSLGNNMTAYAEFKYWMLRYMIYMRDNYPTQYQAWLDCPGVCDAYTDFEVRFKDLIDKNVSALGQISQIIKSSGYQITINERGVWFYEGQRGYGAGLEDYNKLIVELNKPEYIEMDNILKRHAGGVVQEDGIRPGADGNLYLFTNGVVNTSVSGLYYDEATGWWLLDAGRVDIAYDDLYYDPVQGWWKVTGGAIDFGYNDLYCSPTLGWWKVAGGTIDFGYNDLYCSPTLGWWKIAGGTIDFAYSDLYCSPTMGFWKVTGGMLDLGYTDLYCSPLLGWWKIVGGSIDFGYTDLYCSPTLGWWKVNGGTLDFGYSDIYCSPTMGYWLVTGGMLDFFYDDIYCSPTIGFWKVKDGTIDFFYDGIFGSPTLGYWKCKGGSIDFGYIDLYIDSVLGPWFVSGGTIDFTYNGELIYDGVRYQVINGYGIPLALSAGETCEEALPAEEEYTSSNTKIEITN